MVDLNLQSGVPIYEQLVKKLKSLAALQVLKPGEALPSVRVLAKDLKINPNTVQKAYQQLEREGVICSVYGKGSFVSNNGIAFEGMKEEAFMTLKDTVKQLVNYGVSKQDIIDRITQIYIQENGAI